MPHRGDMPGAFVPTEVADALENLRKGTRQQYESDWEQIFPGASKEFRHDLGEIPWVVDVLRADTGEGHLPSTPAAADFTLTRANIDGDADSRDRIVTVTNDSTDTTYFFKVRAM